MARGATTQTSLSRMSGVKQPSISQFPSGQTDFSDGLFDALLSCMGSRLNVNRTPVPIELDRSHRLSW